LLLGPLAFNVNDVMKIAEEKFNSVKKGMGMHVKRTEE
jgi:hypothetical protein